MSEGKQKYSGVRLGPLLAPERILILKGKQSKNQVLETLVATFGSEEDSGFIDDMKWGIFHREDLMNTAMGNGIAVPHTLQHDVEKCMLAMALCPDGIGDYQTPDAMPVRMVIMLLSPEDNDIEHLQVIASIGSRFYDGRLKTAFLSADTPEECLEILTRAEES